MVQTWARDRGYAELAPDALLDNVESQQAHTALGFTEAEQSVKYREALGIMPHIETSPCKEVST